MEEAVRWSIKVSKETDLTLRTFLGAQGAKKGDLSKFIEEAVRWHVFNRTVQEIRERNYLARYQLRAAEAERATEMEILKKLEAKYRTVTPPPADEDSESIAPAPTPPRGDGPIKLPVQASLF